MQLSRLPDYKIGSLAGKKNLHLKPPNRKLLPGCNIRLQQIPDRYPKMEAPHAPQLHTLISYNYKEI